MKKFTRKTQFVNRNAAALKELTLLMTSPQVALPLLSLIGQAQRSGSANLNNTISGNSGHNAEPKPVWQ
jgi:hypothetical protein